MTQIDEGMCIGTCDWNPRECIYLEWVNYVESPELAWYMPAYKLGVKCKFYNRLQPKNQKICEHFKPKRKEE